MSDILLSRQEGPIRRLTLNRPEAMNALNLELLTELHRAVEQAGADDSVRVIIISGGPGRFSAGLDLKLVRAEAVGAGRDMLPRAMAVFKAIQLCPKPVIAQIDGPTRAGGFDLAVMCDFRYASPRASFGQAEILVGLSQLIDPLWKIIGLGRATELAMTGRVVRADEAERIGLVNAVFAKDELADRVMEIAGNLAERDPAAMAATKALCREVPGMPVDQALWAQGQTFARLFGGEESLRRIDQVLAGLKDKP